MATSVAKTWYGVGAQMLGIGTDALIEQLTPFGPRPPRLLNTDPTGFMPQQLLSGAMVGMLKPGEQAPPQPGVTGAPGEHQGTGAPQGRRPRHSHDPHPRIQHRHRSTS